MEFSLITFLLSTFSFVSTINVDCSFKLITDNHYTCVDINLDIARNRVALTGSTGQHLSDKTDTDVKVIYFLSPKMRALPQNVTEVFPNLKRFTVHGLNVQRKYLGKTALINGDFRGADSLTSIVLTGVNLNVIKDNVFEGANNLFFLSLEACGITSVQPNGFNNIPKLRSLSLNYNLLQMLDSETFSSLNELRVLMVAGNFIKKITSNHFINLHKVEKISFFSNVLEEVDQDIFEKLPKLKNFYLEQNVCTDMNFIKTKTSINEFKELLTICYKPKAIANRAMNEEKGNLMEKLKALEIENERLKKETKEFEEIDKDDLKAFLKLSAINKTTQ